jgi:hypothetical protein
MHDINEKSSNQILGQTEEKASELLKYPILTKKKKTSKKPN